MGWSVAELGRRMTSREQSEWQVYEELEPFGERREDYRAASICLTIANANGAKNAKLEDFLLTRPEKSGPPDVFELARALGAKVVNRGESE